MTTSLLPRFSVLPDSQLSQESMHSVLISLLRGLAAIEVAAAHLRSEFYPGLRTLPDPSLWYQALAFLTGFAHQAVVVFFLISGWLVGGSLLNKWGKPDALKLYAIDRFSRLWTVLVPTFLLMLAIGIVTGELNPGAFDASADNPYSALVFAANLVGLQTILLPEYGGNYPLWSLANETWYYVLFPLLMLFFSTRHWQRRAWLGAAMIGIALLLPWPVLLYFSLWLLGAGFSRVRVDCSAAGKALLLVLLVLMSVYFRLTGENDDQTTDSYLQDLALSLPLLLLLSASLRRIEPDEHTNLRVRRLATFLSDFSFTLYVVHIPLLELMRYAGQAWMGQIEVKTDSLADLGVFVAMLVVLLLLSYGFYLLFEARTAAIRRMVKALLLGRTGTAPAVS